MALNTQKAIDTPYVDDAQVNQDVEALHKAGRKKDAVWVILLFLFKISTVI